MTVLSGWCRYVLRTRWKSLVVLMLLVALSTGTVVAAVAGSRRGRTAWDRLSAVTLPADVVALPNEPGFDWDQVRSLPSVAALSTFVVGGFGVEEIPPERWEDVLSFPPADTEVWHSIERPVVLSGRLPDPTRDDEVVISDLFDDAFGIGVGDPVTLELSTPEQIDAGFAGEDVGAPAGPKVEATVVGIIRSPWFTDGIESPKGFLVPSPGLYAKHPDELLGTAGYINALVRLDDGAAGIPRFKQQLAEATGRDDIDVWDRSEADAHIDRVTGFEANSLLAFALAAAIASLVLLGQAITRYGATTEADLDVLESLGLAPSSRRNLAMAAPTAAGLAGTALGVVAAALVSDRFPIGTAHAAEPRPGRHIDWVVVAAVAVAVPGFIALVSGWRGRPRPEAAPRAADPGLAQRVAARLPVPLAVGTHLTFDRGRHGVPVRPALAGAIVGVAGVIGALTFSAGVHDATSSYDRFGQTYDLFTFFGYNGEDFGPVDSALQTVADDPDVTGVIDSPMDVAQVGDESVSIFGYEPVGDGIDVVLVDGRLPNRSDEIALGPRTASAIGAAVGDRIELVGTTSTLEETVTGIGFIPAGPHNDYASGGWVTTAGYDELFDGFKFHFAFADTDPGADRDAVITRLADAGAEMSPGPIFPPTEQAELAQIERIPLWLAAFLALLAIGALGHTVASTAKVRRHDLMVLRALGFRRVHSRVALFTQATLIAAVGFVFGLPIGIAAGRTLWRIVAEGTPVQLVVPTAWIVILATPVLALVAANLLAIWPAHRVARQGIGEALRTE